MLSSQSNRKSERGGFSCEQMALQMYALPFSQLINFYLCSLIEGCPTVLVGVLVLIFLPARPETTKWLSEEERKIATERLTREVEPEARSVNWDHVRMSVLDYKAWMVGYYLARSIDLNLTLFARSLSFINLSMSHSLPSQFSSQPLSKLLATQTQRLN
jgi:phytoene dehydrogenase-like protein